MRIFAKRKDIRKNLPNIHTLCCGKCFNSKYFPLDIIISFSNKIPAVVSEHIWEKPALNWNPTQKYYLGCTSHIHHSQLSYFLGKILNDALKIEFDIKHSNFY